MKRSIPLLILIIVGIVLYVRFSSYLTFQQLQLQQLHLQRWTEQHFWQASLLFISIYTVAIATSIPGSALFLSIAGGFLFGLPYAAIYVIVSATTGATLFFLAVKFAAGSSLTKISSPKLRQLEQGFQKNALNYLLFLRLIPVFPFWLINIGAALLNVPLRTFVIATFFGIIPGVIVYTSLGSGLTNIFASNSEPNIYILLTPKILIPIVALALLCISPIIYKHAKEYRHGRNLKT